MKILERKNDRKIPFVSKVKTQNFINISILSMSKFQISKNQKEGKMSVTISKIASKMQMLCEVLTPPVFQFLKTFMFYFCFFSTLMNLLH
jgi:hypothetical protein